MGKSPKSTSRRSLPKSRQIRWQADSELEDQLVTLARQQLAGYKKPRRFVFHDALPKTSVGKLDRKVLKQQVGAVGSPRPANSAVVDRAASGGAAFGTGSNDNTRTTG